VPINCDGCGKPRAAIGNREYSYVVEFVLRAGFSLGIESGTGETCPADESFMTDIARLFQAFVAPAIFVSAMSPSGALNQRLADGHGQRIAQVCPRQAQCRQE
jgi:hypothetical protein